MSLTRSQRIHRGFHRTGILIALVIAGFVALVMLIDLETPSIRFVGFIVGIAVVLYGLCRGLGWIIAGFVGD